MALIPAGPVERMEVDDDDEVGDDSSSNNKSLALNILAGTNTKINATYLVEFSKAKSEIEDREERINCKIIRFSSDLNFDEVLTAIASLNPNDYPNLFIFVFEANSFTKNDSECQKLQENLTKFDPTRPLLLQLTSQDENETKFYYKEENSNQFLIIDQQSCTRIEKLEDFPSFIRLFSNRKFESIENDILKYLNQVQSSSLIIRFLRTLELSEDVFKAMIIKVGESGTKADLFAALDVPFGGDGQTLSSRNQDYLTHVFSSNSSVLLSAIEHKNIEIINYLITDCSHLIEKLPLEHQMEVSTAAFETNQLGVLCDLLEISDFPFPLKSEVSLVTTDNERLTKIIEERKNFHEAIRQAKYEEIGEFIKDHSRLRFIYSLSNKSALKQAVDLKNYKVYYSLNLIGLKDADFGSLDQILTDKEFREARKCTEPAWNLIKQFIAQNEQIESLKSIYRKDKVAASEDNNEYTKMHERFRILLQNCLNVPDNLMPTVTCPMDETDEGEEDKCARLIEAAKENDLQEVIKILQGNVNVNYVDKEGYSAIEHAFFNNTNISKSEAEKQISEKIMIQLLDHNSQLPSCEGTFDYNAAPNKVKEFIDRSESLSEIYDSNHSEDIYSSSFEKDKGVIEIGCSNLCDYIQDVAVPEVTKNSGGGNTQISGSFEIRFVDTSKISSIIDEKFVDTSIDNSECIKNLIDKFEIDNTMMIETFVDIYMKDGAYLNPESLSVNKVLEKYIEKQTIVFGEDREVPIKIVDELDFIPEQAIALLTIFGGEHIHMLNIMQKWAELQTKMNPDGGEQVYHFKNKWIAEYYAAMYVIDSLLQQGQEVREADKNQIIEILEFVANDIGIYKIFVACLFEYINSHQEDQMLSEVNVKLILDILQQAVDRALRNA